MALSPPALADAPMPWQWGFQDSASSTAQAVMDLHHDIMFFLITITVLVLYLVFQFATKFHYRCGRVWMGVGKGRGRGLAGWHR